MNISRISNTNFTAVDRESAKKLFAQHKDDKAALHEDMRLIVENSFNPFYLIHFFNGAWYVTPADPFSDKPSIACSEFEEACQACEESAMLDKHESCEFAAKESVISPIRVVINKGRYTQKDILDLYTKQF